MTTIPRNTPFTPTTSTNAGSTASDGRGSGGGGGDSTQSSSHVPQLNAYAAHYGGDYSGSASNQIPGTYQPEPQDAPGANIALADSPAAKAVRDAANVGDVSPDVFAMACLEAVRARNGDNGSATYGNYLQSIKSAGLRNAVDTFVNQHIGDTAVTQSNNQVSYRGDLRAQARGAYPATTGTQAQAFKNTLYNLLGQYGSSVRDAVWPKLQADGLVPNDDGSIPQPSNNAGDAQSAYSGLSNDQRQQLRNNLYNAVQGTPYGALWDHLEEYKLIPPGTTPTASSSSTGSTTNNNNGGNAGDKNVRDAVYNYLKDTPYGTALWQKIDADHILPGADGSSANPSNSAGDARGIFGNISSADAQRFRDGLFNRIKDQPGGQDAWARMDAYGLLPSTGNTNNPQSSGSWNSNTNNNGPIYGGSPPSTSNGGQRTYSNEQANAFKPTIADATVAAYQNAYNNTQDQWVKGAAGRVLDNLTKLQADQNWLTYANNGLARAGSNGFAPDGQNNMQPASYWASQQQQACNAMQNDWEAQRDLEAQYWGAEARINPSDQGAYQKYVNDASYTTEGSLPAGFRSAPLPNTGGQVSVNTNSNTNSFYPQQAATGPLTQLPALVDSPPWIPGALDIFNNPTAMSTLSQSNFALLSQSAAQLYNKNPAEYFNFMAGIKDSALAGALNYAVQDVTLNHPTLLRSNGASEDQELQTYSSYYADAQKGNLRAWAPGQQTAGAAGLPNPVTPQGLFPGNDDQSRAAVTMLGAQSPATRLVDANGFANGCAAMAQLYQRSPQAYYAALSLFRDPKMRDAVNYAVTDCVSNHPDQLGNLQGTTYFASLYNRYGTTGFAGTSQGVQNQPTARLPQAGPQAGHPWRAPGT